MNIKYVLERLKEPSTWSAIAVLFGVGGWTLADEYQSAFAAFFSGVFVLINVFWKQDTQSKV